MNNNLGCGQDMQKELNRIKEHIKKTIYHDQGDFVFPWDVRMLQHMQINQCDTPH